jgi:Rps23 Pro-64 3,4-dihydroxylase Tpa1-like proline 4-hydroxylase
MNLPQTKLKLISDELHQKISDVKSSENYFEEPFKHFHIDNFLPESLANECLLNFPNNDSESWEKTNTPEIEVKMRSNWKSEFDIPDGIVDAIRLFNSAPILSAISEVLDIPKLIPDPYFTGGGLNATVRGGLLDIHVDGNYHDATGLNRRVNAILYLNQNWQPGWGGEFGLYNYNGEELVKEIEPIFNRLVVFDTHDYSFHGLPNPLNFPNGDSRKSIILYYYTKEARPSDLIQFDKPHSALWKKKNFHDKRGEIFRDFK